MCHHYQMIPFARWQKQFFQATSSWLLTSLEIQEYKELRK